MFKAEDFFEEKDMQCKTCEGRKFIKEGDGEGFGLAECPDCVPIESCNSAEEFVAWFGINNPNKELTKSMFETLPKEEQSKLNSLFDSIDLFLEVIPTVH